MKYSKGIITQDRIERCLDKSGIMGVIKMMNQYDIFSIKDEYSIWVVDYYNKGKLDELFDYE